jgi:glycerophosphoryl diester phosphodiesterase
MTAFRNAPLAGADTLEFDVQRTCDNQLIAFHDRVFKRISGKNKFIKETTLEELHIIDHDVPLLEEVLRLAHEKNMKIIMELKYPEIYPGIEEGVLKYIYKTDTIPLVSLASFSASSLERIRRLNPSIPLIINYRFNTPAPGDDFYAASVDARNLRLFPWRIARYRKHSSIIYAWNANNIADMMNMLKLGVNGIITDFPDRLRKVLEIIYSRNR